MKTVLKRKILVTRFPYESRWGGEELHTVSLMEELDKRGYEAFFLGSCRVLLKAFHEWGFLGKKVWLSKPPVSRGHLLLFTLLSPFLFLWAGFLLWRARRHWAVDMVYMLSLGEKLLMTPWARFFGIEVLWLEHARIGKWLTQNPWRFVYRFLSKRATTVVTSRAMVKYLKPWVSNVVAIPCAVLMEKPQPLRKTVVDFLKGGFALGSVARFSVDKGVDILVHLVQDKPDVRLILVGDGPLRPVLEKMANPKQVLILPSLPRGELMSLYKTLDLFVLPSIQMDPFGMVAAEAMALGAPVLLTSACGIAEDLRHGREAWIVEPRLAELDKGLKRLMHRPALRESLRKRGKAFVHKHYRLTAMVDAFDALMEDAAKKL